jgi:hypothetical protein
VRMLRPTLPKLFGAGATKQLVSKYSVIVGFSRRPSQTRLGRALVKVAATFGQEVGICPPFEYLFAYRRTLFLQVMSMAEATQKVRLSQADLSRAVESMQLLCVLIVIYIFITSLILLARVLDPKIFPGFLAYQQR